MAIIQQSVENEQNQPDQAKRPNIELSKVVHYIKSYKENQNILDVFKTTVDMLAHVETPSDLNAIGKFKIDMQTIDLHVKNLLQEIDSSNEQEVILTFFSVIIKMKNPSGSAGIVLNSLNCQNYEIPSPAYSEHMIKIGFKILCDWVKFSYFIKNLEKWINGIIDRIEQQNHYQLLTEIVSENIYNVCNVFKYPYCMETSELIIRKMLLVLQYDPNAVIKDPTVVKVIKIILKKGIRNDAYNDKLITESCSIPIRNTLVGLVNLGNTCYMNSVLQALIVTKQFSREILLSDTHGSLFETTQKLLALLLHSKRPSLTPQAVLNSARPPGFKPGHQQDSSEFLGHLLDALHEQEKNFRFGLLKMDSVNVGNMRKIASATITSEADMVAIKDPTTTICDDCDDDRVQGAHAVMPSTSSGSKSFGGGRPKSPKTIIQRTFSGNMSVTYKCLSCGSESKQFDSFRDFQLSFPETKTTNFTIQQLLEYNCSTEKLINDNQYACEQCKMLCDGERYTDILNAPEYLILTVKYFKYDQKYNTRTKLMHKVKHDETISMKVQRPNVPNDMVMDDGRPNETTSIVDYRLYAAVVHSGVSLDAGHYFTYGADQPDLWYRFEDSHVTFSSISELHNLQPPNTPYILFYRRITDDEMDTFVCDPMTRSYSSMSSASTASSPASSAAAAPVLCDLPSIDELPPLLREYVNKENISYLNEARQRQHANNIYRPANHGNNFRDSNNDDPPQYIY